MDAVVVSIAVDAAVTVHTAVGANVDITIGARVVMLCLEVDAVKHADEIRIGCVDERDVEQHSARVYMWLRVQCAECAVAVLWLISVCDSGHSAHHQRVRKTPLSTGLC